MCVIAICRTRTLRWSETQAMDAANPDGIGVAWVNPQDGLVEYWKGLDAPAAQSLIDRLPLPQIVHFRWASVGGQHRLLSHPFPLTEAPPLLLGGAAPSVLFHNGTWANWEQGLAAIRAAGEYVDPSEPWSDTRVMAVLATLHSPHAVAQIVGPAQRLAVLHGDGSVWTAGTFHKHEGILVSNLWWMPRPPVFDWSEDADEETADDADDERDLPPARPTRARAKSRAKSRAQATAREKRKQREQVTQMFLAQVPQAARRYFPPVPRPSRPSRRHR